MKLIPFLTKIIIAPHGITDIGHSILTKNSINLLKIYGINLSLTSLINQLQNSIDISNILLLGFSIVHFRHDFPKSSIFNIQIPKYIYSSLFLVSLNYVSSELLFYYMLLIHVPNHFKLNNFHIKDLKFFNIFLYFLFGLFCFQFDTQLLNDENNLNFVKSIIISHILYQELYVLQNNKLLNQ
jgi:hypothetical protein